MRKQGLILLFILALAVAGVSAIPVTDTFTSNGSWTCPTGIYLVNLNEIGAGAGGAGGGTNGAQLPGGNNGTFLSVANVPVVPGTIYPIVVGFPGNGGIGTSASPPTGFGGTGTTTQAFGYSVSGGLSNKTSGTVTGGNGFLGVNIALSGNNAASPGTSPGVGGIGYGAGGGAGGGFSGVGTGGNGGAGANGIVQITYDTASTQVLITGNVKSGETGLAIVNATISIVQGLTTFGTTSNATGFYTVPQSANLVTGQSLTMTTSSPGYQSDVVTFTPLLSEIYPLNIVLIGNSPFIPAGYGGMIYGTTMDIFGGAVPSVSINITNSTNINTTVSTATVGFYNKSSLPISTIYSVNGSKTLYDTSQNYLVSVGSNSGIDTPQTVSLLHFDNATNNGVVFTDESGKVWVRNGSVVTTTNWTRFGSSSYFNGASASGAWLQNTTTGDLDFGTGDWTIEMVVNRSSGSTTALQGLLTTLNSGGSGYCIDFVTDNSVLALVSYNSGGFGIDAQASNPGLNNFTTKSVVIERAGNNISFFINGTFFSSTVIPAGYIYNTSALKTMRIGSFYADIFSSPWTGWIDELRITKGLARYPYLTSFTPNNGPFSPAVVRQDLTLTPRFQGVLFVKDASTLALIPTASLVDEHGVPLSGGSGAFSGIFSYGGHSFTANATGYTTSTTSLFVVNNFSRDILLQQGAGGGSLNVWWTPHTVQITIMSDSYGTRLPGVSINATYNQSSMPTQWINELYGVQGTPAGDMVNSTLVLGGPTGSDGTLTTTMLGSLQYDIVLNAAQYGLSNYRLQAYPSDAMLNIYVPVAGSTLPTSGNSTYVALNNTRLYITQPNISYVSLCIDYQDLGGTTSQVNEMWWYGENDTVFNTASIPNPGTTMNTTCKTIPNTRGTRVYWNWSAVKA